MRLHWLAIGITLIVTFSTFGYPLLFDRLYIGLLAVTALVSVKWDKNLFTLCLISIAFLLVEETAWLISSSEQKVTFKIMSYCYLSFACYVNRYSRQGKISVIVVASALISEFYWFTMATEGPEIYWYAFMCANALMVKHLVLIRPHFCSLKFPQFYAEWKITKTDVDIGYLLDARLFFEFLTIGEYLLRHLMGFSVMVIYTNYHYVAHALLSLTFYIYLRSFAETIRTKFFPA